MTVIIHSTLDDGYDFYFTDNWKKKHHFKISTFEVPSGLLSEAIEVITPDIEVTERRFQVLSDFDADIEKAELLLKAKIRKRLNIKYLKTEGDKLIIVNEKTVVGNIDWSGEYSDTQFDKIFTIDGKRITIEQFVEMLSPYEGFDFKFEIFDQCDDIE
jgi:hypothetical protein